MPITYIAIHILCSFIFIWRWKKVLDRKTWDEFWIMIVSLTWPIALIIMMAFYPPEISNPFKHKRKVLPDTYHGYYWGEVVLIDGEIQAVVIWDRYDSILAIKINESNYGSYGLERVSSIQSTSELAEELKLYENSRKLQQKASELINESKEISKQAMKLRKTVFNK